MTNIYFKYIFQHPRMVLAAATLMLVFLAFQATKLEVDASGESLVSKWVQYSDPNA